MAIVERPQIYEGTNIPSPTPTVMEVTEVLRGSENLLQVNFGPNHPSTHGVLRLIVDLNGEQVVGLKAVIGYLHTGFEKNMEAKTWWKGITYAPRIDYLAFQANEFVFVRAVEKLLGIEVPPKAVWMRTLLNELNRIHSHLVWLGTAALELGAISVFWYAFRERDQILDLFELVSGPRMHTRYFQVGGLAEDIPTRLLRRVPEVRRVDAEGRERLRGAPLAERDLARADRRARPPLRRRRDRARAIRPGAARLRRRLGPPARRAILAYDEVDFDVPVYAEGDVYARYRVHMDEMRQSVRIVDQCLERLEGMQDEPWIVDDRKIVLPPRDELHTSMESLIHHFKLVTEGFRVPEGEVYVAVESPRGELGCYVCSDGGSRPWRVKFRAPSFVALEATATCMQNALVADLIAIVGSLDTLMGEVDR